MKPGGAPSSPRLARRGGVGLRRQGYALMEVLLFVVIATTLTVTVMRSVKPTTVAENNIAKIMMAGLENLMQAHQLSKPSCIDKVNTLFNKYGSNIYQSVAEWCWLFEPDAVNRRYPYPSIPTETFQADQNAYYLPTRNLSDFWGSSNGRDNGQGKYLSNPGIGVSIYTNRDLILSIQINSSQILGMGYDQCMELMNSLVFRLSTQGHYLYLQTVAGTAVISNGPLVNNIYASYHLDPTNPNTVKNQISQFLQNYCKRPWTGSYENRNELWIYLGVRA